MNIHRAKEEIINTVHAYLAKDDYGQYVIPVMRQRPILLMGPPGIGKTQIMEQAARECGIGLVSYTITHHTRQSAVGLPFIVEKNYGGTDYSVTEYTMSEIIHSIYQYMDYSGKREGILFIDEINSVSETLAPTMLQFLQYKTFGNQVVPRGWIIVTAGNPPEYNRSVREFDFVTLDRVRRMDVEPDLDAFRTYARAAHLHPFILSYLELRPGNFYKTEQDVDGIQFVTARGWEDLSELVYTYESLVIKVDKDVIRQFLAHEEIASDAAAYYDLYQKYSEDYDIQRILTGQRPEDMIRKLALAPFDERLSCVELLISGLHDMVSKYADEDRLTSQAFEFLKEYRSHLKERKMDFDELLEKRTDKYRMDVRAGLVTPREKIIKERLQDLIRSMRPESGLSGRQAFEYAMDRFKSQKEKRSDREEKSLSGLENAFSFIEQAFDDDQEMVIFVTELTMDPILSAFLTDHKVESYNKYLSTLLIGNRRAAVLKELERDRIYANPTEWSF